jgi:hypothetical protein
VIKFKLKPESVWISGDDKGFDGTELKVYSKDERAQISFHLNPYTSEKVREIQKRCKKEIDTEGLSIQDLLGDNSDTERSREEALSYIVKDWRGVLDEEGKELECTKENILMLADNGYSRLSNAWFEIAGWLIAKHEQYDKKEQVKEIKNSVTSQDGSPAEE